MTSDLHHLTLTEAAALIRARQLSPVELVTAKLDRINSLDRRLHSFITVTAESAIADARKAESELARGLSRGPLHGIPIAHKDVVWTRGVRTTAHSRLLRDWVPSQSATVFERFRSAGAISLGKTSLHEFAFGSPGLDEAFPAARNPWNLDHMPGSSSSGSAAAVAAGLVLGATGSDTGGSVHHPAAACGIVGMKPTHGRISCYGVIPLAPSMDHVGVLTRTVQDNALMLQAAAGFDPKDPMSVSVAVPDFSALIGEDISGIRIGIPRRFIESTEHTPDILTAFGEALDVFTDLGAAFTDVDPDGLADSYDAGSLIITYEGYRYHRAQLEQNPGEFGDNFKSRFGGADEITESDYEACKANMRRLRASVAQIHRSGIDLLINPGRERSVQTMTELLDDPLGKRSLALRMHSVTGNPALVQPMGITTDGLPLGLQIAAARWREDLIYQVAAAYEAATGWGDRGPWDDSSASNPMVGANAASSRVGSTTR